MEQFTDPEGTLMQAWEKVKSWGAGPNPAVDTPDEAGRIAGFWLGLWHGIIAPVAFIVSLFSEKVHVFEVHNNGKWYVFGFVLGMTAMWGSKGGASPRGRKG